jgi:hypothetical protein
MVVVAFIAWGSSLSNFVVYYCLVLPLEKLDSFMILDYHNIQAGKM